MESLLILEDSFYKSAIDEYFVGYVEDHLAGCKVVTEEEFNFPIVIRRTRAEVTARRLFALRKT